eukprot:gnl/TRDRNA2_/TRDRNA2_94478_c0_seq1.p1 gnl/TRDRNA2_/TRDRNA2_94478_c0~~gnl/TRDRNA2_/TRDRNA2_94478_c0_seq1.p1  ORF type:complete len:498 (-),score=58.64 gnl/TRDRNA2_/TRDRNA2_94478_c0_seq1:124-1617(-)
MVALHRRLVPARKTVLQLCSSLQQYPAGFAQTPLPYREHARPFFDTAQSFFGGPQPPPSPFPVVLLSGFLGAGKTTVLEQLLRQHHGFKLGIVVNDLASVNVDANVLRDAISKSGAQSVSLENGCVCCTAAEDLQMSVQNLIRGAGSKELDAIVVELSGVAEPARARQVLQTPSASTWLKKSTPLSVRTVTVVDSPAFATDYLREQTPQDQHDHSASGECDDRYGALLAEQVESADMLLLNKADVATEQEIQQAQALVRVLNESATVRATQHGKVKISEFLDMEPKVQSDADSQSVEAVASSQDEAAAPVSSCCAAKTCSATNKESTKECESISEPEESRSRAEIRFGITSFVYSTERLMSRVKLLKHLGEWQKAREKLGNKLSLLGDSIQASAASASVDAESAATGSPLAPILRSKGILLLDANPEVAFYWSHAGKSVSFSVFGPWPPNIPQAQGGFGARRTELVFIGAGYDETAIRGLLDSCLLSDDELGSTKPQ